MERGFYQPAATALATRRSTPTAAVQSDWREALPILAGAGFSLRELELSDAPSLLAMLTTEEVTRFISPPPTTVEGFERFITWTRQQRAAGQYICFAVVPAGMNTAIGLFQVRSLSPDFSTAEWGFALGSEFWGTGLFVEGARRVIEFAFDTVGIHRLEARASVENGRGNGALRKLGAVQEGVLRRAFLRNGRYHDQVLWSLIDSDWDAANHGQEARPSIH
jgi:[ribosomal protein S5]-alanine N-acetyltransferase